MAKTEWNRIASLHRMQTEILPENGVVTVSIDKKKICLGRFGDKFFAVDDRCLHAGARLGSGWCDEKGNVVCPHHRLHFNPDSGQLAAGKGYYVKPYPVEVRDGAVYIGVGRGKGGGGGGGAWLECLTYRHFALKIPDSENSSFTSSPALSSKI